LRVIVFVYIFLLFFSPFRISLAVGHCWK